MRRYSVRRMKIGMVTIDCAEPTRLAPFWTEALGYKIVHDMDGAFLVLAEEGGDGPWLGLQKVGEPRSGKNRVHLDMETDDREADVRRLVDLGATVQAEHKNPGFAWTVLADPDGNEFCVGGAEPEAG